MKNIVWPVVILIIASGFGVLSRYELVVKPPVVAKIDCLTGDTWIVNSGYWVKVKDAPEGAIASQSAVPSPEPTGQKAQ